MPKPFDATLKDLIRTYPADWLKPLGVKITDRPEVLSAELSSVTAAADTLIRVGPRVIHLDVESGPDDSLASRMLMYNVLAHRQTGLPVHSIAVLLRSKSTRANQSEHLQYEGVSFRFQIVRIWEVPTEELIKAGTGFLPLTVLGKPPAGVTRRQAFPALVEQIAERVAGRSEHEIGKLMTATYILGSMHVEPVLVEEVINHVLDMKELPGYKFIMEKGAVQHARESILRQGRLRFGVPSEKELAKLDAIEELDRLDRILDKVPTASGWSALLRAR